MRFAWITIAVSNMERSLAFYRDRLGLRLARRFSPGPDRDLAFFEVEGSPTEIELIADSDGRPIAHGGSLSVGLEVGDLDAFLEGLARAGVTEAEGPFSPGPMIRFAYVRDPDGVRIQLIDGKRSAGGAAPDSRGETR